VTDAVASALAGDLGLLRAHPYDPETAFWRAADDHHVDLLLLDQAHHAGADRDWTDHSRERARSAAIDAAAFRSLRDHELRRVLELVGAAGVPCLVIKGAALAHLIYRQPHTRRRIDADLLVRTADADRVSTLLHDNGYVRATEISGGFASSQMHFDRADCADHRYALDVHWRILNTHVFAGDAGYDAFAPSRVAVPGLGPRAWTLGFGHALALACTHRVAHHYDSDDLAWLWDVHLLAAALDAGDAAAFVEQATRSATRAVCAHTLSLAQTCFGTPAAAALIERVRPRTGDRVEASAQFLGGALSQAEILRTDLTSLGWRRGLTLLREHLFPPADYMRSLYAGWPPVLLPAAYLHRIVNGAPKWLRRP
jgi:hypothetical protein